MPIYGGEAVYLDGRVTGRVRSCAYGFTVGRNIAFAYLPADLGDGPIEVEVFGDLVAAEVVTNVPLDPEGKRVRGYGSAHDRGGAVEGEDVRGQGGRGLRAREA